MDLNACGHRASSMGPATGGSSSAEPHTGTTIVACTFKGGVVLGADGRVSTGNYVSNRASCKLSQLTDNVFLLRSGSAADTQAVGDYGECCCCYSWQCCDGLLFTFFASCASVSGNVEGYLSLQGPPAAQLSNQCTSVVGQLVLCLGLQDIGLSTHCTAEAQPDGVFLEGIYTAQTLKRSTHTHT
jgi:hypothetical protein